MFFPGMAYDARLGIDLQRVFDEARCDVLIDGAPIKQMVIAAMLRQSPAQLSATIAANRLPSQLFKLMLDSDGQRFFVAFWMRVAMAVNRELGQQFQIQAMRLAFLSAIDELQRRMPAKAELRERNRQEIA